MRPYLMRALAVAVWYSGAASQRPARAQAAPDSICEAVSPPQGERTGWYDADGDFILDTTPQTSSALAQRFAGTYALLVVTSEGSLEKVVTEYKLQLAAPNAVQAEQVRLIPAAALGKLIVPLIATMEFRRSATGNHKTVGRPWPDIAGSTNFEYWPGRGKLGFTVGLGIDTGTLFHITDVEADGSFAGRWTDGGLVMIQLDTPVGPVLERQRGYFCAMRQPR